MTLLSYDCLLFIVTFLKLYLDIIAELSYVSLKLAVK